MVVKVRRVKPAKHDGLFDLTEPSALSTRLVDKPTGTRKDGFIPSKALKLGRMQRTVRMYEWAANVMVQCRLEVGGN